MRIVTCILVAWLVAACAPSTNPATTLPRHDGSGLVAVYAVGGRNVRVLIVRPPSIVLAHESFVPPDQSIRSVRWTDAGVVIETNAERFALDTHTWVLASLPSPSDGVASARARPRS